MTRLENENGDLARMLQTVQRQAERKADFIAPTSELQFKTEAPGKSKIIVEQSGGVPTMVLDTNSVCFDQIAQRAEIDVRTARRFRDNYPVEFDKLLNAVWQKESEPRMVRTFLNTDERTGIARSFNSDKFKTFDHVDMLNQIIPQLIDADEDWTIRRATVTDKRLYLAVYSRKLQAEGARVGDVMSWGLLATNSETGHGSVAVLSQLNTLACLNGMTVGKLLRASHVTSSRSDGETWSMLSDEAKEADNHALRLKLRDVVKASASKASFEKEMVKFRQAAGREIEGTQQAAVEQLGKVLRLNKSETSSVLDGLIQTLQQDGYRGHPVSQATLANAVTACAHSADGDTAADWEERGARVINLSKADWRSVAVAA